MFPETFWVRLENGPANTYLKEARTAGVDLLRAPLVVSGEPVSLELAVSTKTARLEGTVLDPFAGSGSTLAAANAVGYASVGVECDAAYVALARRAIPRLGDTAARKNTTFGSQTAIGQ